MTVPTQSMVNAMVRLLDDCNATQVAVTFVMTARQARTAIVRHSTLLDDPPDAGGAAHLDVPPGCTVELKDHPL